MGIRDLFRGRRSARVIERRVSVAIDSIMGMTPVELYRTQPALRSVVSFLADNIAGLPLKCYVRESDTDRPRDTTSKFALLLAYPSLSMTTHELMRATASDYLLYGRALWVMEPTRDTPSGWKIEQIPWSWVNDTRTADGMTYTGFEIHNPDTLKTVEIDADNCIVFNAYDPRGVTHVHPPTDALKQVLSEQISAWGFRNSVWKNGGRVTQTLNRPADAPEWTDAGRDRFAKSWKAKFAGEDGTDTGGTPLLEDGMTLNAVTFNAREAEWAEATRLAREDTAAVYHVNPSLIWHTDSQTYASAKDNARALYADTLAPHLDMFEKVFTCRVAPVLGVDASHYAEFDLSAKLAASFEEQMQVLQSAVGAPFILRDEARARLNLPALPDDAPIVTPLNVLVGGDGYTTPYQMSAPVAHLSADGCIYEWTKKDAQPEPRKSRGKPAEGAADEIAEVYRSFFKRQKRSVLNEMDKKASPDWWNAERWNRELADDLEPVALTQSSDAGRRALMELGIDGDYNTARTRAYIRKMCERRAEMVNQSTLAELEKALDSDDEDDEALMSTPAGVFDNAVDNRADSAAAAFAVSLAAWGALEACQQNDNGNYEMTKTWVVTSSNPRPTHAAMDGETVPYGDRFSNGALYPGDCGALEADEVANCQCEMDVSAMPIQ